MHVCGVYMDVYVHVCGAYMDVYVHVCDVYMDVYVHVYTVYVYIVFACVHTRKIEYVCIHLEHITAVDTFKIM